MKLFEINGSVKCGHRLYNAQYLIVAHSKDEAIELYKSHLPQVKCIHTKYKYDVRNPKTSQIIVKNFQKIVIFFFFACLIK